MMRSLTTTTVLIMALAAALCLSGPGLAAEPAGGEAVAWIETVHPRDALAAPRDGARIVVVRRGEAVSFPSSPYMAALHSGDIVRIDGPDTYLDLCTDTGRVRVTAETAGKDGYRISGRATTVWENFTAWLADLTGRNREARLVSTSTRGAGQDAYPSILDNPDVTFRLIAGKRALHIRWKGGEAPFRVLVLKGDRVMAQADAPKERRVVLPELSLSPGEYELVIKGKNGLEPGVDPLRGNADVTNLLVTGPESLPPMPRSLAEAPLPDEARHLLHADWLAHEEGGAWLLEARQMAAALAGDYPPARDWLERWGGE